MCSNILFASCFFLVVVHLIFIDVGLHQYEIASHSITSYLLKKRGFDVSYHEKFDPIFKNPKSFQSVASA